MRRESLNTTAVTNAANNSSFDRAGASDLVLPKLDERLLRDLEHKREKLEERIEAKNLEKERAVGAFVGDLEKELEALKAKDYRKETDFKKEIDRFGDNHKKHVTEILQASDRLQQAKDNFIGYLKEQKAKRA